MRSATPGSAAGVVVVGAGFAGLAAAFDLTRRRLPVTVLEARDRVGGRVWSVELSNGTVAEMGAEWIEPDEAAVRDLASAVGVRLLPAGIAYRRREAPGPLGAAPPEQDQALAAMASARVALGEESAASATLGGFLDGLLSLDERQRRTLRARLQGTFAADLGSVALRAADLYGGAEADAESDMRTEGGNQRIAEAVAGRLPDVRLRHMVKRVDQSRDAGGVVVRGESPAGAFSVEGSVAILAVPAPLLLDIVFAPPLPDELTAGLRELPMGVAAKLAVPLAVPVAPRAIQEVEAPFWCWAALGEGGAARPVLASFAGSRGAMEALRVAGGDPAPWLARVLALNPDARMVGDPVMVAWESDPLARGCYAAFDNRSFDRRELFSRTVGRLVFAGEHTAGAVGTMNGAVETGLRAAEEAAAIAWLARG